MYHCIGATFVVSNTKSEHFFDSKKVSRNVSKHCCGTYNFFAQLKIWNELRMYLKLNIFNCWSNLLWIRPQHTMFMVYYYSMAIGWIFQAVEWIVVIKI